MYGRMFWINLLLLMEPKVITLTMFNDYPYSLIKDFSNLKVLVQVKHSLDYSSESQVVSK